MSDTDQKQTSDLEYKQKLQEECRRILEMPSFLKMLDNAIEVSDNLADGTTGQEHDRHVGAKKALKDLRATIKKAADFKVQTQAAGKRMYE